MSIERLDNLVKTRNLKREAPDQKQVDGMIESAKNRITDLRPRVYQNKDSFYLPMAPHIY